MIRELITLVFRDPKSSILILSGLIFILLAIAREINILGQVIRINLVSNQVRSVVGIVGLILFLYGIHVFPSNLETKTTKESIPYIGIGMITVTPDMAKQENLSTNQGVLIVGVTPNSPAENSGLLENDLIVNINNRTVVNKEQIQEIVKNSQENEVLLTKVIRGNKILGFFVFPECCKQSKEVENTQTINN